MTRIGGRKAGPVEHGTIKGYKQEYRRGLVRCPACKEAWATYYRRYREVRNEK